LPIQYLYNYFDVVFQSPQWAQLHWALGRSDRQYSIVVFVYMTYA